MTKRIYALACMIFVVFLALPGTPVYAAPVRVTMPAFRVTLNGKRIENDKRQYPLIVYRDITYFPMTFYDCHYLGLDAYYTDQTGLDIHAFTRDIVPWSYYEYESSGRNPQTAAAQIAAFPIRVNGKVIENEGEEYPLLLYKDVTYFPLIWRYAVDEFGWDYRYNEIDGLVINSFTNEDAEKILSDVYGKDIQDIIRVISDRFVTSEWLNCSFRAYSRHENRLTVLLSEHRLSGTKWYKEAQMTEADNQDNTINPTITGEYLFLRDQLYYKANGKNWRAIRDTDFTFPQIPDLAGLLGRLPDQLYGEARWSFFDGYPCLVLMLMDETPASMPELSADGMSISAGGINRHEFFIDLNEGCLRSYWVSTCPFFLGENGERELFAPSTTFFNIMDFDYNLFTIPTT